MLSVSPGSGPMTFYFDHTALRASFPTGAKYVCALGAGLSWLCLSNFYIQS